MKKIVSVNLIATFLLFIGCTKEKKIPLAKNDTSVFRWAVPNIPKILDWRDCSNDLCRHQSQLLMEGLSRLAVTDGNIRTVPALAERWESISPKEIEITLRKNIFWEDGSLLTADHFLRSWERAKTPLLKPIATATALDKHTLRIVLETPHPNFMAVMADPATFPWAGSKKGIPFSLGPYRLFETTLEKRVFVRNSTYYGTPPAFSRVEFLPTESSDSAAQMFAEGRADFVDNLPLPHGQATLFPTSYFFILSFAEHVSMQNTNLRKALRLAIDTGEFQRILKRDDVPSRRLFPFEPREAIEFAPDRARELFESVYPKGNIRQPLTLAVHPPNSPTTELAKNLQAQWLKNLGPTTVQLIPDAQNPDIVLKEWTWDPRRPFMGMETELTMAFRSQRKVSTLSLFASTEEAIVKKLLGLEEALLEDDLAVIPLLQRNRRVLLKGNIRGLHLNALNVWDLREISF